MRKFILLYLSLILATAVHAQDSVVFVSLNQALKMGIDSSKTLKISAARLQLAEAKYNQALDATIPSVQLNAGYTRLSNIDEPKFLFPGASEPITLFPVYVNNYSAGVTASETIFSGFRLKYAKESQKLLIDAAKFEFEKDKTENSFAIINAYFNLFKLNVSAKIIEEDIALVKEQLRVVKAAANNGLATKNDVLRLELRVSNLELTQIDVKNNISIANYNFNLMLGQNESLRIVTDSNDVEAPFNQKSFNEYLSLAMEKRNDLASADRQLHAQKNALSVAQNSYLPDVTISGGFLDARPNARYIPPVDEYRSTWSAGVNLHWNLVSLYSNKHNVDEVRAVYRQKEENYNLISDQLKSEINQNFLLLQEAIQKTVVMKKSVEQSGENYRLMNARFQNALVLLSDLLEAENQLLNSKINYSFAKADIQIAYYRLLKSTGSINQ